MSKDFKSRGAKNSYMYIQDNLDKYIKYPIKLKDATNLLYEHNELINLWYKSDNYRNGYTKLWSGEAWALPDEYSNLNLLKFIGIISDSIYHSDHINILVDANDDTPKNLPKKTISKCDCSDTKPSFSKRSFGKLPSLKEEEKIAKSCIISDNHLINEYCQIRGVMKMKELVKNIDDVYHIPEHDILHKFEIRTNEFLIMTKNGQCFLENSNGVYSSEMIDIKVKEIINAKISK